MRRYPQPNTRIWMSLSKMTRSGMRRRWQPSGWWTWRAGSSAANWTHSGSRTNDGSAGPGDRFVGLVLLLRGWLPSRPLIARSNVARRRAPGRARAGPIVRPPRFRPEWADEGGPSTGDESIGRTPASDQAKYSEAGDHCPLTL